MKKEEEKKKKGKEWNLSKIVSNQLKICQQIEYHETWADDEDEKKKKWRQIEKSLKPEGDQNSQQDDDFFFWKHSLSEKNASFVLQPSSPFDQQSYTPVDLHPDNLTAQ